MAMTKGQDFTPRDFIQLVKELNTHEAELKIKLAQAGIVEQKDAVREDKSV
jgi:hypothetical protein